MKRTLPFALLLVLVLIGLFGAMSTAQAAISDDTVSPRYTLTSGVSAGLSIDENGVATCSGSIRITAYENSIHLIVQLQKKLTTTWLPIKSWYDTSDGETYLLSLRKTYNVSSGTYRVYVEGTVTTPDGDSEAVAVISGERTYP